MNFDNLREAEWQAGRAISAVKPFADKATRQAFNDADFILAAVRSAGQLLCDPATSQADRQAVTETLLANLFSTYPTGG